MQNPADACEVVFRQYSRGDEEQIIELLKDNWSYLRTKDALDSWKWLYTSGPYGGALIVLADHRGKLVGHYSMFPLKMRFGNHVVRGGKAEGSVVHQDYRGNIAPKYCPAKREFRIFGELIPLLWAEAAKKGTAIVWGFPNAPALKPQVRAGYEHLSAGVIDLVMPKDLRSTVELQYSGAQLSGPVRKTFMAFARAYCRIQMALHRPKRVRRAENVELRRIDAVDLDDRLARFVERYALENNHITVERDADYIRWRFLENAVVPHRVYVSQKSGEFTGMVTLATSVKGSLRYANVIDILGLDGFEGDLAALLDFALKDIGADDAVCVKTWLSDCAQSREYVRMLKRAGFFRLPTSVHKARVNVIYKILDEKLDKEFASDQRNWYITMAFTEGTS